MQWQKNIQLLDANVILRYLPNILICHKEFLLFLLKGLLSFYTIKSMMPGSLYNPFYPMGKMSGKNIFLPLRFLPEIKICFFLLFCFS